MESLHSLSWLTTVAGGLFFWFIEGIIPYFSTTTKRKSHAMMNLTIAGLNLLILLPGSIALSFALEHAKPYWAGIRELDIPPLAQTVLIVILIDLWMYTWHRLNHINDFLWRFHSVHHSDPSLDVTTAWRFHYGEILFSEMLRFPVFILIGASIQELLLYSMIMTPIIEFHHSNISIPSAVDRILRLVIPTPLMHRLHHSSKRAEHDANYGSMLSFWDRLFGSFLVKQDISDITIGLANESDPDKQRVPALLSRPFNN